MHTLSGSCHCGQLRVALRATLAPEAMPVRVCQCSFCRRHGSLSTADPAGDVVLTLGEPAATSRYTFGLRTAEFLVCARCGVYVAAVMPDGDAHLAVVNVLALDDRACFTAAPVWMDYDGEDVAARAARRRARWMRATLR